MGSAEIKPGEGVRPGSVSRGPSGSSLGFLTDQDQQDSFSACSTAGHAAARDEVLTGHGPGNGSSGAEWDCLIFAVKYQDAFTKQFQLAKNKWSLDWIYLFAPGRGLVFTWQAACYSLQPSFWQTHVLRVRALVT